MNWQIDINVILQILSITAMAGMGWQKLKEIERDVERLEHEIIDYRELKTDLMVIKTQLVNMAEKLDAVIRSDNRPAKN